MAIPKSALSYSQAFKDTEKELKNHLPPWKEGNSSQKLVLLGIYAAIYFPVAILLSLVIGVYSLYIIFYVYPLITDEPNPPDLYFYQSSSEKSFAKARGYLCLVLVSWCLFWLLCSMFKAIFTDPGQIPQTQQWDAPYDEASESSSDLTPQTFEKRKDGASRACPRCNRRKPDRSHHCKQCQRCNLKMDHHCNWIANCVGYFNYKYFYLILFYGSIALSIFIGTFWEAVIVNLDDPDSSTVTCFLVALCYSLMIMLGVSVVGFFIFHSWLIAKNYTTIEFCEKRRQKVIEYRESPYAFSVYYNFQEALGDNPCMWFFPFKYRKERQNGLSFKFQKVNIE